MAVEAVISAERKVDQMYGMDKKMGNSTAAAQVAAAMILQTGHHPRAIKASLFLDTE